METATLAHAPVTEPAITREGPKDREMISTRVVPDQAYLPRTSPSANLTIDLLSEVVTLSGEAAIQLARVAKQALEIEKVKDAEGRERIVRASLIFPAYSAKQVEQARNLINPQKQEEKRATREKRRAEQSANGVSPAKPRPLTREQEACRAALQRWYPELLVNSYHLVEVCEQGAGQAPLIVSRLLQEFPLTEDRSGVWKLEIKFLQALLQNYLRFYAPQFEYLDKSARQGVAQEVAQLIGSHLGLIESKTQPFTSFASLDERNPEQCRQAWLEAMRALIARTEPFQREKRRGEERLVSDDLRIFRRGPRPKRMTVRWVASDAVIIRKWKGELYAFLPLFEGLGEQSPLWRFHTEEVLWWQEFASEFETLPAWHNAKQAELTGEESLVCVPLCRQPRLEAWLRDPERKVCWTLLTEKEVAGRPEFQIHVVTKKMVQPRLRPNLLVVIPTLENKSSCLRCQFLENGQFHTENLLIVDPIPLEPIGTWRHWEKARKQKAIRTAREVVELAHQLDANLAIGLIEKVEKRKGNSEQNTLASRWNYATLIEALANKAQDHSDPVAVVARVTEFERLKAIGKDATPEAQIRAVANLAWKKFQKKLAERGS